MLPRPRHHYDFDDCLTLRERSNVRAEFGSGHIDALAGGPPGQRVQRLDGVELDVEALYSR